MAKRFITILLCSLFFANMAFSKEEEKEDKQPFAMECQRVASYIRVYRCENEQVICYIQDGISCKFKEVKQND